jgi:hypothetical protein
MFYDIDSRPDTKHSSLYFQKFNEEKNVFLTLAPLPYLIKILQT